MCTRIMKDEESKWRVRAKEGGTVRGVITRGERKEVSLVTCYVYKGIYKTESLSVE